MEGGTEVGGAVAGQRPLVRAVGVHQVDLQRGRPHEALRQQRAVLLEGRALGAAGPPHDFRAVGAEERAPVVAGAVGQALRSARLVHDVEVEVPVAHGSEHELAAAAAPGRLGRAEDRDAVAPPAMRHSGSDRRR